MSKWISLALGLAICTLSEAQHGYWQQRVDYTMTVDFNVNNHQYKGKQVLLYENNSPDTLYKVFYHLYYNAFQPGSSMDIRSRWLPDPDARVGARVAALKPEEIGYQKVNSLKQDGALVSYEINETILEVKLNKPILPKQKVKFEMDFEAQIPIQIRRSGRNSAEGIDYSAAQWYPKMAEYDRNGWHPNPYIAREFYGVWGDYDVKISIDSAYTLAATGEIQNAKEVGKGYNGIAKGTSTSAVKTWHFKAQNVHDFVWAADRDYVHDVIDGPNGMKIHFFYQDEANYGKSWREMQPSVYKLFEIMNKRFGQYPYNTYSIIQGGDGGMEYPMATLITGKRSLGSLIGVSVHEVIHSWYQMLLGTNESLYSWMDEGFTTYAGDIVMNELSAEKKNFPFEGSYSSYFSLVKSGLQEALTTHADHFNTNRAYSIASYSMGSIFISQLGYVIGEKNLEKAMLNYYYNWRFKHPTPDDCLREMEKVSGMVLDWYKEYWVNQTHVIDYAIKSVSGSDGETEIQLERVGKTPMPVELWLTLKDGKKVNFYIPLDLMRGEKEPDAGADQTVLMEDWQWVAPVYSFKVPYSLSQIEQMEIDPSKRMADVDRSNGMWPYKSDLGRHGRRKK